MNEKRIAHIRVSRGYHILPIRPWMQLELHEHVGEWNTKRIWRFKGLVIKVKKKNHADGTFTIRGKTAWHVIEKVYPLSFPNFDKVLLSDQYKVRRAKLYYIREKVWKDARMKSVLTNAERWVDLLELAKEEIDALKKAYDEANIPEEADADQSDETTQDTVEASEGTVEESQASDDTPEDDASKE